NRLRVRVEELDTRIHDLLRVMFPGSTEVPEPRPIDVGHLVRQIVQKSPLDRKPALDVDSVLLRADSAMLQRIIENLLSNAIKHTPPATPVTVVVRGADLEGALITVEDEGPGVPLLLGDRVFEPFVQGSSE